MRATLKRTEAATYLGISPWLLWKMTKQGLVPHFKAGNRVLYRKEAIDQWMADEEKKQC